MILQHSAGAVVTIKHVDMAAIRHARRSHLFMQVSHHGQV